MDSPALTQFLHPTPWRDAHTQWFSADWSVRSYARLTLPNKQSAILLKSPPDDSPHAMVGHMIGEWSRVNRHFKALGLNVPTIIAQDLSAGFILMDDFGDETIANKGMDAYLKATDCLITMRNHPDALSFDLKKYEDTHVYKALRFYPQYILGDESLTDAWFKTWKMIEDSLPPCPRALTHIDFAAMNLMWINCTDIGIIDFQAACDGPFVYDIVNLLEDIRRDIPDDIKIACKNRYKEGLSEEHRIIFDKWYPVITAQFHCRVLGQIQFLSKEKNRTDLLEYYNPLRIRLEKTLQLDVLSPILRINNKG